jgi:N-acetylglucosaminyldiphosphoundecaprenol N-acetyl-beta-D-mannosaminyltransferase
MNGTAAIAPGLTTEAARIGPVRFDPVTQDQALEAIAALIARGRGGFVVTPNVDHVVLAHQHTGLADAYRRAALSLVDGQPIVWMARLLGRPVPEKVSGSDFVGPLMATAAQRGWRVFLFGAAEAVSATAARTLTAFYPGLQIVGRDTTSWDPNGGASHAVVERIRLSKADLVVVALGCPKQELWMARHADAIGPAVAIGLGGTLDFVAGKVRRSPPWMSHWGLEWLYRLAQEPRRMAYRYLVRDPQILPLLGRAFLDRFRLRHSGPVPASVRAVDATPVRRATHAHAA